MYLRKYFDMMVLIHNFILYVVSLGVFQIKYIDCPRKSGLWKMLCHHSYLKSILILNCLNATTSRYHLPKRGKKTRKRAKKVHLIRYLWCYGFKCKLQRNTNLTTSHYLRSVNHSTGKVQNVIGPYSRKQNNFSPSSFQE